ncbi:MAG: formate dehydrogenase accessory protein FdhE [Candidatus Eisenbacteria sp.]|nr:formate dehydrogenase accessory protein FdhE [Candidatus Eisenbacteria bacterium]
MEKAGSKQTKPTAPEKIGIDKTRLKEMIRAVSEAIRKPQGASLFDAFQDLGSTKDRQNSIDDGIYLFRAHSAEVSAEAARVVLRDLLHCFGEQMGSQAAEWEAIGKGLAGDSGNPAQFLACVLRNDARAVTDSAHAWGVSPDSLSFLALFWARPFRAEAARRLLKDVSLTSWRMGFCPICGHWPAFAYLSSEGDRRSLRCAACTTTWKFDRIRCPFCLATDTGKLSYFTVDDDDGFPVYVCDECKRYLKHRREEKGFPREEDVDFVLSAPLDYVAASQGYIQESSISVRFDEPDGEAARAYRAKARYEEGPSGPSQVH